MTSGNAAPLPPGRRVTGWELFEWHASHADERFSETRDRCRDAILGGKALHYLALHTGCVTDFTVDVLNDSQFTDWISGSPDSRRSVCQRAGRDLSGIVIDVDDRLEYVRTGALIRTVVQGARGSMYCNSVVPGQYLTGHCFTSTVENSPLELCDGKVADITLAQLVTGLRKRLSLGSQNPGGWLTFRPSGEDLASGKSIVVPPDVCGQPHIEKKQDDQRIDVCAAEVDCRDLHYVAYCRDGEVIFSVDHLGHKRLNSFYTQINVEDRRRFYHDFCQQFPLLVGRLGRIAGPLVGSRPERVVLDVEQGALYSYRIRTAEYLVGVTINQHQVAAVDDKLARLARRMKEW